MPRKRSSRRGRRNFAVLPINDSADLGTLANQTVTTNSLTTLGNTRVWLNSAHLNWTMTDMTPGEGPIFVGLASSDLSATEVLEALTASPTGPGDIIALERQRRPVRLVGSFDGLVEAQRLNDGRVIKTRLGFMLDLSTELTMFLFNKSGATLTTGATVTAVGKVFGNWA